MTGYLSNGGREGKRQAEEGRFAPLRASRATLHLLASKSPESRSEEVASGREGVDEQAQKDAWGPPGREPTLQSASVSSAAALAQAPSKQRPGVRQARLLWETGVSSAARKEADRTLCKRGGGRGRQTDRQTDRQRERERKDGGRGRQTDREPDRQRERKEGGMGRQTERERERERKEGGGRRLGRGRGRPCRAREEGPTPLTRRQSQPSPTSGSGTHADA